VSLSLAHFDRESLAKQLTQWGCKPSHAGKVLRHFYESDGELDPTTLEGSSDFRHRISELLAARETQILSRQISSDGTTKLLIGFTPRGAGECVLMPGYRDGAAAGCLSSQIGCAMGCDFCASTRGGLERNLEAHEIVEQFLHLKREARALGRRLKTIVFMGMGEPMHNFDNVIDAIRRIADPDIAGIGWRQVTVSTVGVVPGIDRLAEADLNVHLALSLHAPDDQTRSRLVPRNRRYPVAEIMSAARRFQQRTRRVVNIEYCILAGVNDSDEQAHLLAGLMKDFRAHVNLIPYNSIGPGISGRLYARPARDRILAFLEILRSCDVVAHIRDTRGEDVWAACGQLRQLHK